MRKRIIDRIRLRWGLRWKSSRPPIPLTTLALVATGMTFIYLAIRVTEAEAMLNNETAYAQVLRDCMSAGANGEQGGFYFKDSQSAWECKVAPL